MASKGKRAAGDQQQARRRAFDERCPDAGGRRLSEHPAASSLSFEISPEDRICHPNSYESGFADRDGNFPDRRFKFPARAQKIPCLDA
jgi:hypothetical protein